MIAALAAVLLTVAPVAYEPPPLVELDATATAYAPAERMDPPPPPPVEETTPTTPGPPAGDSSSSGGRCVGWEPLLRYYSPGWDVARMSRIAYRESRCRPEVRNPSGATGLLQLMPAHCRWLDDALGEPCSVRRLQDPEYLIRAAAALWRRDGYRPWNL